MTLHSQNEFSIPEETARVARAAYPKGNLYMKMRDALGTIYQDESFAHLFPANGRPVGISHFGVHVENMPAVTAMFKARGANTTEITLSGTKAILSNISDPFGNRMELTELPPESLHRQAMQRWR